MKKVIIFLIVAALVGCNCLSQIPTQIIPAGDSCRAILPDYRDQVMVSDNCVIESIVQLPAPGTVLDANNLMTNVVIAATDNSGNTSAINFDVLIYDVTPPVIVPDSSLLAHDSIPNFYDNAIFDSMNLVTISGRDFYYGAFIEPGKTVVALDSSQLEELGFFHLATLPDTAYVSTPITIDAGMDNEKWYKHETGAVHYDYLHTGLSTMYKSERFGNFSYRIPTGPGDFNVKLYFAEITFNDPGKRVFSVRIEEEEVLHDLDILATVGKNVPLVYDFQTTVSQDGWLDIKFITHEYNAKISGITIDKVPLLSIIN